MIPWLRRTYVWFTLEALVILVLGLIVSQVLALSLMGAIAASAVTYDDLVNADSPLGYWKLNEPSGSTLVDSSGNARNGTYTAAPTLGATGLLAGETEKAVTFNGTSQFATVPHAAWMDTASFTAGLWFSTTTNTTTKVLLTRHGATGSVFQITMANGLLTFTTFNAGTGTTVATTTATYNDGLRHSAFGTFTGGAARFYVDGMRIGGASGLTVTTSSVSDITIAAREGTTFLIAATIEKVELYSTSFTQDKIVARWRVGSWASVVCWQQNVGTSSTTATFAGTTTAGHQLLLSVSTQNGSSVDNTMTTPTGWALVDHLNAGATANRGSLTLFRKTAAGSDANPTYVITGANTASTILEEWSGIDGDNPVHFTFTQGTVDTVASVSCSAGSTTNPNTVIYAVAGGRGSGSLSSWGGGQVADTLTSNVNARHWSSKQVTTAAGSFTPSFTSTSAIVGGIMAVSLNRASN